MRKYLVALFLMGCFVWVAKAGVRQEWGVPIGQTGEILQSADYGGVDYSSSAFSIQVTTVTYSTQTVQGTYIVYGVNFSSGPCTSYDFVDVFDSTSSVPSQAGLDPKFRLYNSFGSTATATGIGVACSGFSGPRWPVRFYRGLLWQPSSAGYNMIELLYRKAD